MWDLLALDATHIGTQQMLITWVGPGSKPSSTLISRPPHQCPLRASSPLTPRSGQLMTSWSTPFCSQRASLPHIPMCIDHSKCGEDRRNGAPPGGDRVYLQEVLEKAQGASSSRTGTGDGGDEADFLFLLSLYSVHPQEELIWLSGQTSWMRVARPPPLPWCS